MKQKIVFLSTYELKANACNVRSVFGQDELNALAQSISEHGIIQPLIVRRRRDQEYAGVNGELLEKQKYEIIAGERRWRASRIAGIKKLPCVVVGADSKESALLAMTENLQREDLTFFEVAFALDRIQHEYGITQTELAKKLSLTQPYVANKLRLLRFTPEEMRAIEKYSLSERHARELIRVRDVQMRKKLLSRVALEQLSIKQTATLVDASMMPELPEVEKREQPRQGITILKLQDVKCFFNSLERSLNLLKTAGVDCRQERSETEEYVELLIRIPKKAAVSSVK